MNMKIIVLFFLTFIYVAHSVSIRTVALEEWELFKLKYNKSYETAVEDKIRFANFMENKLKIALHNAKYEKGETSYFLDINKYGDMTYWEFDNRMKGCNKAAQNRNRVNRNIIKDAIPEDEPLMFLEPANVELPKQVNWIKKGAVTEVKDQGDCASCWAFSATGALEGQHFLHNGTLVYLSEQNLIDCSRWFGNEGCCGGFAEYAFDYVKFNRGIDTEKGYPYEARDYKCRYDPKKRGTNIKGYVKIPEGDEYELQKAVATVGPISVNIDTANFHSYKGGVYYDSKCSSIDSDHAVLVVGYGTDPKTKKPYWLVKNSWGNDWGEDGYIRMARNRNNNCGIATDASYPIVE